MGLFTTAKDPLMPSNGKKESSTVYLIFSLVFALIGLTLFLYGFATPQFLYYKVVGFRNNACWERNVGLWEECVRDCLETDPDWDCRAWGYSMVPEDMSIGGTLQISGLVFALIGLLWLFTRCTRWSEQTLLGTTIFFAAAGILPAIGSIYMVACQTVTLKDIVDDMEGTNTIDIHPGLSFILNIIGCVFFFITSIIGLVGCLKMMTIDSKFSQRFKKQSSTCTKYSSHYGSS